MTLTAPWIKLEWIYSLLPAEGMVPTEQYSNQALKIMTKWSTQAVEVPTGGAVGSRGKSRPCICASTSSHQDGAISPG